MVFSAVFDFIVALDADKQVLRFQSVRLDLKNDASQEHVVSFSFFFVGWRGVCETHKIRQRVRGGFSMKVCKACQIPYDCPRDAL